MARVVVPGVAHHVTQRGNRRCDVFADDADRRLYLSLLRRYRSHCCTPPGLRAGDGEMVCSRSCTPYRFTCPGPPGRAHSRRATTCCGKPLASKRFISRPACLLGHPLPRRKPAPKPKRRP